jgi:Fe-S cluster assembly protein SufD
MVTEALSVTHKLLEELSAVSGKTTFIDAAKIGSALQYLEANGIPNSKKEDYKYCNVEAIIRKEFSKLNGSESVVKAEKLKNHSFPNAYNIYVLNGRFDAANSQIPKGASICNIRDAGAELKKIGSCLKQEDAFAALNTAYADRGLFIHLGKNAVLDKSLVIHYIFEAKETLFFNTRNLFLFSENSQAVLAEIVYPVNGKIFCNHLTEVHTEKGAHIKQYQIQNGGNSSHSVNTTAVSQEMNSNYTHGAFTFSGSLVRNNLSLSLDQEYCEGHLYGLTFTKEQQLVDNHTLVDHQKPNCQSNELYKGIADGKSTLVFNGQIFVERDAQKTNAYQSSKNILLSSDATVDAKPELEIYANDVKCSHGTSTGKVDENALFYLKSRGIGTETAQRLLLHAFAHEVIQAISDPDISSFVENLFERSLEP